MKLLSHLTTLLFAVTLPALAQAQNTTTLQTVNPSRARSATPAEKHYVTSPQAYALIQAAVSNAIAPCVIAVVDPTATLVALLRMDDSLIASLDIAEKKARTVALFRGNKSQDFGLIANTREAWNIQETNGGLIVWGGGVPLVDSEGWLVGALAVSGGTMEQDTALAERVAQLFLEGSITA